MGAAAAADPGREGRRQAAEDQHAVGDERHLLSAAHRLPLALSAARRLSAPLDGLQHLPRVSARRRLGGDLGGTAHGPVRTPGPRSKFDRSGSRQPIAEVGEKGGGKDDAVGYDAGKKVEGRKIPALSVEIVKRTADMIGFVVLPRRWVVERTFSLFGRNRPRQGLRKPRLDPACLRHPRLHPARPQATLEDVGF